MQRQPHLPGVRFGQCRSGHLRLTLLAPAVVGLRRISNLRLNRSSVNQLTASPREHSQNWTWPLRLVAVPREGLARTELRKVNRTMRCASGPAIVALVALMSTTAVGKGIDLDSREYKLMLVEEHFVGEALQGGVDLFIRDQLVPAVRTSFGGKAADELTEKGVELDERRIVRFWDTETCALSGHGFALRERVDLDADDRPASEREITLKYRSPDLFLVAGTRLDARAGADDPDTKLEEDVGALAVRVATEEAVVAMPRSTRSQFSRSTKQTVDPDAVPTSLGEVEEFYPHFTDDLRRVADDVDMSERLVPSLEYRELVYESSKLDVAAGTKAKFADDLV